MPDDTCPFGCTPVPELPGLFVDPDGHLVDKDGNHVDEAGRPVDTPVSWPKAT